MRPCYSCFGGGINMRILRQTNSRGLLVYILFFIPVLPSFLSSSTATQISLAAAAAAELKNILSCFPAKMGLKIDTSIAAPASGEERERLPGDPCYVRTYFTIPANLKIPKITKNHPNYLKSHKHHTTHLKSLK